MCLLIGLRIGMPQLRQILLVSIEIQEASMFKSDPQTFHYVNGTINFPILCPHSSSPPFLHFVYFSLASIRRRLSCYCFPNPTITQKPNPMPSTSPRFRSSPSVVDIPPWDLRSHFGFYVSVVQAFICVTYIFHFRRCKAKRISLYLCVFVRIVYRLSL